MPGSMSDIVTEYMPERMSDRMSELFIYTYIWLYMYKGHIYFKMICQKLCPDSVSGWGSLEIRQFKHFCVGGLCLIYTHNIYIYILIVSYIYIYTCVYTYYNSLTATWLKRWLVRGELHIPKWPYSLGWWTNVSFHIYIYIDLDLWLLLNFIPLPCSIHVFSFGT